MGVALHFTLGFITSFLGMSIPSMLNMTAAKISLDKNRTAAIKYAIGVSIVVFFQAYLAILFTKFLRGNPVFVQSLQKIAMVIFALLSVYFFYQSKKEKVSTNSTKENSSNSFIVGLLLSALNMFSIPFYCGVTTALDVAGWLQFSQQNMIIFVTGSTLGTFALLFMYVNFAGKIRGKTKGLSKNLNLILSVLTGALAVITFIKIV